MHTSENFNKINAYFFNILGIQEQHATFFNLEIFYLPVFFSEIAAAYALRSTLSSVSITELCNMPDLLS